MFIDQLFRVPTVHAYLDTATYGLPPRATADALHGALVDWERGETDWQQVEAAADFARAHFARLLNTTAECLALLPSASAAASIVGETLTEGEIIVCPDDHASVTLPFLNIARRRRLHVREAQFDRLAEMINARTRLVACSHVHYATGKLADIGGIVGKAAEAGAATYLDVTQSAGVLPLDVGMLGVDYIGCAAYKWLCCPRGTGFLYVAPQRLGTVEALAPSRRATSTPLETVTLGDVAFSLNAAKLDFSLAWLPWIGARHSLEAILTLRQSERTTLSLGLACRLAEWLKLPRVESAICAVPVNDIVQARQALKCARIAVSVRRNTIRVSPYLYNSEEEIERLADVLRPLLSTTAVADEH